MEGGAEAGRQVGPVGEENKKTQHTRELHGREHWMTIRIYSCIYICICMRRTRGTTYVSPMLNSRALHFRGRNQEEGSRRRSEGNENWTCMCVRLCVCLYRMYFPAAEELTSQRGTEDETGNGGYRRRAVTGMYERARSFTARARALSLSNAGENAAR